MRAVTFERFGEPAEVLKVEDVEPPPPGEAGVSVRMLLRPINPSDLLTIRGRYGSLPPLPATPGREGVGVVEKGDGPLKAQRVVPLDYAGTWQEQILLSPDRLVPVPSGVSDEAAAQAFVNPLSAWAMLHELQIPRESWLLQSASASALGKLVIQLAGQDGVRTINLVRRPEQADELYALGADHVLVDDDAASGLPERVREITGEGGVSYALDAVGGRLGGEMINALSPRGVMLVHGSLAHPETMPISSGRFLTRSLTLKGFWLNEWLARTPFAHQRDALAEILGQLADGRLQSPRVEATYDLSSVVDAVRHAERSRDGKIMLSG